MSNGSSPDRPFPLNMLSAKRLAGIAIFVVAVAAGMNAFETVEKGTYQIRQFPVTGTLSVKMTPGMWCQCFGSVQIWPVSTTFDFQKGHPMPTRFNDGSTASGG